MAFCDFCTCEDCQTGQTGFVGHQIFHAKTSDGQWICDTCYLYNVCGYVRRSQGSKYGGPPCTDHACEHRPKLVTDWQKAE